jgi:hypothetical protein
LFRRSVPCLSSPVQNSVPGHSTWGLWWTK